MNLDVASLVACWYHRLVFSIDRKASLVNFELPS